MKEKGKLGGQHKVPAARVLDVTINNNIYKTIILDQAR
jgi:hypothetical protein